MPKRPKSKWLWGGAIVVAALLGLWGVSGSGSQARVIYDTRAVEKGDLVVTVIATGTVQPTTKVELSSELSGTLAAVSVDFNEEVREGQVLARLDDTKLKAALANAEAQLMSARARLASAEATVTETRESLNSAEALDKRGLNTRLTYVAAQASHARAEASVETAKADVILAEANLASQASDLEKAEIRSPINGIVLNRAAEKGQIVAASLNAPILFTLAEDLRRMELRVSVDEADIGRVAMGQAATFTVDAYPGRVFDAEITSLRYAPDESEDVVSYTAVLSVMNDELLLRPGMTATATITVNRVEDALLVPVSALRYAPPAQTEGRSRSGQGLVGLIMPGRPSGGNAGPRGDGAGVWVLRGGQPVKVPATSGASDGSVIEVVSEGLSEGDQVILSQRQANG